MTRSPRRRPTYARRRPANLTAPCARDAPPSLTPILVTSALLQTVVETPAYIAAARGVLSEDLRARIVNIVAKNVAAGVLLGGGLQGVRVALPGRSMRGDIRMVFLFAGANLRVFLFTVFAKNKKASLSIGARKALVKSSKSVTAIYRRNS